jgi:hypothetical protein
MSKQVKRFSRWTAEQDEYLKSNYTTRSMEQMAEAIGRTKSSVGFRMHKLRLVRTREQKRLIWRSSEGVKDFFRRKKWLPWTDEEKKFIQDNYEKMTRRELAKALKRSYNAVKAQIDKGLITAYKSPQAISEQCRRRNNGMFPKGSKPHNTFGVGVITFRHSEEKNTRIYHIKVAEPNVWQPLNRYIYEAVHGKLPEGMLVVFRDGNTMNLLISNLQAITKEEHARRNSASLNLPDSYVATTIARNDMPLRSDVMKLPALIELKRQSIKLNREIKNPHATQGTH